MELQDVHATVEYAPCTVLVAFKAHHVSLGLLASHALSMSPVGVTAVLPVLDGSTVVAAILSCPSGGQHHGFEGRC